MVMASFKELLAYKVRICRFKSDGQVREEKGEAGREVKIDWVEEGIRVIGGRWMLAPLNYIGGLLFLHRHGRSLEDHGNQESFLLCHLPATYYHYHCLYENQLADTFSIKYAGQFLYESKRENGNERLENGKITWSKLLLDKRDLFVIFASRAKTLSSA